MNKIKKIVFILVLILVNINSLGDEILNKKTESLNHQTNTGKRKKIGLVLSGGGAKGFAHIGVLKVLEKENINIDYITGTSMGALIGALYSLGYSAEELEEIVLNEDWISLMDEKTKRKDMPITEKLEKRSAVQIPLQEWSIKVPAGLIEGQRIEAFLHKLTWGKFGDVDFTKFQIPFTCIATDLENGVQVVFSEGNLVKALRASISIPTIFTPLDYQNKILVDGMLVNNFPVKEVRDMGAEFVIGVDVGQELYSKEKLKSVPKILEQTFNIKGALEAREQRKFTDILIVPDLEGYNSMSYEYKKELIKLGEEKAREQLIKARMDSKIKIPRGSNKKIKKMVDLQKEHPIRKIEIIGTKNIEKSEIIDAINIDLPTKITNNQVHRIVEKLYIKAQVKKVSYTINEDILIIEIKENGNGFLELGGNYNDHTKASIYAKVKKRTHMNFKDISKIALKLGEYPELKLNYIQQDKLWKTTDLDVGAEYASIPIYIYENQNKIAKFNFSQILIRAQIFLKFNTNSLLSLGGEAKSIKGEPVISNGVYEERGRNYISQHINFKIDTVEKGYFYKEGSKLDLIFETGNPYFKYKQFILKGMHGIKLNSKSSLKTEINYGKIKGGDYPENENIFLGGGISFFDSHFKFEGLENMEIVSDEVKSIKLKFQTEFKKERYISIFANKAWYNSKESEKKLSSFGFEIGSNSGIGPIKLSLARNIDYNRYIGYINIGYGF
ncbi:MAG: patatin-like phospholipase family protein [Fusobacteriota bacterium]